jgi:hypothetical protein
VTAREGATVTTSTAAETARSAGQGLAVPLHYVDWPAILAGTVLAVAISVVLLTFGSAIGLSIASFEPGEGTSARWLGIAAGLWFVWVAVTSFAAGGYLAGRLRRPVAGASVDEAEVRDGAHGILVWATGALVGAILATSGVTGAIGAAGRAAGSVAQTATEAVGGSLDFIGARLLSGGQGPDLRGAREDVSAALTRSLADGRLTAEDRDYLVNLVAQRTGQTPEEVGQKVDAAVTQAHDAYETALDTTEQARRAGAIAAFVIASTLLASAAAAGVAATTGGDHRDRNVPFKDFGR